MSTHSPSLRQVLSETWRVIAAHLRHFLALSALFLLPVSFSTTLYYLHSISTISTPYTRPHLLIYILASLLFTLCAIPSITTTTFAAFYLVFVFGVVVLVAYIGLPLIGLEIDYDNPYFLVFVVVATIVLGFVLVYMQVEWCLSSAVVVLESKWGFEPLRRSSHLVKGARWLALSMTVLFASIGGVLTVWYSNLVASKGVACEGWVFVQMVVYVVISTVLSLYGLVANTVLFAYCKTSQELKVMIDEETGGEYLSLPKV
ncbi:Unknown protein [Striga hermonthica]|uniref:Uncharacterized protein n=1 Tax=Striga hermonthica TaxID=68872 RepID=A0A9N7RFI2_STRHE|nr:Unknown protein [Striga hermonthica]